MVAPVAQIVQPVTDTLVAPVVETVQPVASSVVAPVVEAVRPVTDTLVAPVVAERCSAGGDRQRWSLRSSRRSGR